MANSQPSCKNFACPWLGKPRHGLAKFIHSGWEIAIPPSWWCKIILFFYPIFTELYSYKAKWQIDHPRWLWRLVLIRHRKSTIFDVFAHTGKEKNIRHTASLQPWSKDGRKVKKTYRTSITWVWSLITSQGNHLISIVIIKKRRFRLAEKFCWYLYQHQTEVRA